MPELSHLDPQSAALLVMDYQVDTLTKFMTAAQSADAIAYEMRQRHEGPSCPRLVQMHRCMRCCSTSSSRS